MRNMGLKEVKGLTQSPTASAWQRLDLKLDLADSCTLTTTLACLLNAYIPEASGDAVRSHL